QRVRRGRAAADARAARQDRQAVNMLAIGAKLGSYEVVGSLGAGGMGEVYRARDTKLGRDVAIKLLPEALAGGGGGLAVVYAQPFPATGSKYRIAAGLHPLWSRDDKEVSYVSRTGGGLQLVKISKEPTLTTGDPVLITPLPTGGGSNGPRAYDRTPDDGRFVLFTQTGASGAWSSAIQILLHWSEELTAGGP